MKIGIIGAGEMGSLLAKKLGDLGHRVSIANSSGVDSLNNLASETGATAVTINDVTKDKEIIIISIPSGNIPDLPKQIFKILRDDVVVIDTCNYYPTLRDGEIKELNDTGIDSLWVQNQHGVSITKVFNSILATSIKDAGKKKGEENRIAITVSGDTLKSKQVVFELVDSLGFDSLDLGHITQSWKQQPGSSIYCRDITLKELKKRVAAMGYDWAEIRKVILPKRKEHEILMKTNYTEYLKQLK